MKKIIWRELFEWMPQRLIYRKQKSSVFKGRGSLLHWGSLYFSFHRKWSKLGTLVQKESNETEMKKKFKILTVRLATGHNLTVYFAEKGLNKGH